MIIRRRKSKWKMVLMLIAIVLGITTMAQVEVSAIPLVEEVEKLLKDKPENWTIGSENNTELKERLLNLVTWAILEFENASDDNYDAFKQLAEEFNEHICLLRDTTKRKENPTSYTYENSLVAVVALKTKVDSLIDVSLKCAVGIAIYNKLYCGSSPIIICKERNLEIYKLFEEVTINSDEQIRIDEKKCKIGSKLYFNNLIKFLTEQTQIFKKGTLRVSNKSNLLNKKKEQVIEKARQAREATLRSLNSSSSSSNHR